MNKRVWNVSPFLVAGIGFGLFVIAFGHHADEIAGVDGLAGPLVALVFDGIPALLLVYAGYRLYRSGLGLREQWNTALWCISSGLLFGAVMGATLLIRAAEGRTIAEPLFPLLVAFEIGALAGVVIGYYNSKARADARQARTVSDALSFVNDLIRHDLRNDLNVIHGHATMLDGEQTDGTDPSAVIAETADEALTRIETTGAVADVLIGNPEFEAVDLAAITAELATQTEANFGIPVRTDLPDHAYVPANAGLRSVVDNLLENAAEHNDADDPRITVTIETGTEADTNTDMVRLIIRDNGPGIPDDQKEALLEGPGTAGNGLTLVRTLVEGYGGRVRFEDDEPRGTRCIVTLPRAQ